MNNVFAAPRPRLGYFVGSFSSSSRQIRSTHSSFTFRALTPPRRVCADFHFGDTNMAAKKTWDGESSGKTISKAILEEWLKDSSDVDLSEF